MVGGSVIQDADRAWALFGAGQSSSGLVMEAAITPITRSASRQIADAVAEQNALGLALSRRRLAPIGRRLRQPHEPEPFKDRLTVR